MRPYMAVIESNAPGAIVRHEFVPRVQPWYIKRNTHCAFAIFIPQFSVISPLATGAIAIYIVGYIHEPELYLTSSSTARRKERDARRKHLVIEGSLGRVVRAERAQMESRSNQ